MHGVTVGRKYKLFALHLQTVLTDIKPGVAIELPAISDLLLLSDQRYIYGFHSGNIIFRSQWK